MIKFLHAADLHLDAPFSDLPSAEARARRQEQRGQLAEIAELANAEQCDLMLLAGDLFDGAAVYP
ncbi:MAG: metallophosphoesterase, partial [Oscillospiraceae bacterium]|nr:metallophosphoesterase [Oscillospiraceae bacterium]